VAIIPSLQLLIRRFLKVSSSNLALLWPKSLPSPPAAGASQQESA
jgi:hypothetical protein